MFVRPRLSLLPSALMLSGLLMTAPALHAQALAWGSYAGVVPFGSGSTATSQSYAGTVAGTGPGSGPFSVTLSVSGGSNAWNGFGVAGNDDGYYSGPNQPIPGITFVNGAPGYNGGIPALSQVSLVAGYNLAGAPVGTPAPTTDQQVLYFDAADGTTATILYDFSSLAGGALPAGSWLFLDTVDQGEQVTVTAASGWQGTLHAGDSSLPRPPPPIPVPTAVSDPTFPVCTPAITQTPTTLVMVGRYGDISNIVPTCANVPVPVQGQTVGYTKGTDSVGIWVQTALPLTTLTISAVDSDPSVGNGMGGFTGPDNNFVLGVGMIVQTLPAGVVRSIPATSWPALLLLGAMMFGLTFILRRTVQP